MPTMPGHLAQPAAEEAPEPSFSPRSSTPSLSSVPWRPRWSLDTAPRAAANASQGALPRNFLAARFGIDESAMPSQVTRIRPSKYIPASYGRPLVRLENAPTGPTESYRAGTLEASVVKNSASTLPPPLLVLSLNGVLCVRPQTDAVGARNVVLRPYVSNFLEYVLGVDKLADGPRKRFAVMIWTSTRPRNAGILLESLGLAQPVDSDGHSCRFPGYEDLDIPLLQTVWDRHSFGLTQAEFDRRSAVVKDLEKVWAKEHYVSFENNDAAVPAWSQADTILVDEAPHTGVAQPNNALLVKEFLLTKEERDAYLEAPFKARAKGDSGLHSIEACASDRVLLQVIGKLEVLRKQTNVSAILKDGDMLTDKRTASQWETEGRKVLHNCDIALSKMYNGTWKDRVAASLA